MHKRDGDRPFADGRRDALDVAAAHVANREDSGAIRLEQVRGTGEWPFPGPQLLGREIRAGFHESLVVESNTPVEPARVGDRPGHHEHVPDVVRLDIAGSLVAPPDPLEPSVPFQANNLGTGPQHDRWRLFDSANE